MKKFCTGCEKEKDIKEFSKHSHRKDGLQSKCKVCNRKVSKNHYEKNKQDYKNNKNKRKQEVKQYILELKQKSKCKICGENRIACLDFHHRNKQNKDMTPARLSSTGWSMKRIKQELNKCDILCSNCHRVLHWEEK